MPRKPSSALLAARHFGISLQLLKRLGGEEKLRSMDPDARAVLFKRTGYYGSKDLRPRGLARKSPGRCVRSLRQEVS